MKPNKLVVADSGWAEEIPDWLKKEVEAERMVSGFVDAMGKETKEEVGDAEVCLYLFTLNLSRPVSHDTGNIYIYLSSKLCKKQGTELMDFMQKKLDAGLSSDEERELTKLRRDLYRARGGKIESPLFEVLKQFNKKTKKEMI